MDSFAAAVRGRIGCRVRGEQDDQGPVDLADFCHLAWLNEHTRNRIFLVGGGNIVEGSESYRRVDEYHRTNQTWHRRSSMMKSRGI